jgi:hypothetical protein
VNCRGMENSIFRRPEVLRELENFVEVRLHTDRFGKDRETSVKLQEIKLERLQDLTMPIYEIVDPATGEALSVFKGADLPTGENFRRFLAEGLERYRERKGR